jgi:hypothetical protein
VLAEVLKREPEATHVLPDIFVSVKEPLIVSAAAVRFAIKTSVILAVAVAAFAPLVRPKPPEYPVASKLPDPMRTPIFEAVVVRLTPDNITVIRFTHDGMPVKSTLVPDAVTAVPDTIGANTPVSSTNVSVLLDATDVGAISRT